jgi:ERCC4-type nuclease
MVGSKRPSTSGITVTIAVKPIKAMCPENQEGLDRLHERLIKAQSNPNSQYVHTLRRGMVSLRECRHPILTHKQACALKNVGPTLARIIIPSSAIVGSNLNGSTTGGTTLTAQKREVASKVIVVAPAAKRPRPEPKQQQQVMLLNGDSTAESSPSIPTTTAKEKAYDQAKRDAEILVLPPNGPWKVVLLIDARERQSQQVVSQCKQSGIPCEERHLPIGDMAWIAQCVQPKTKGMSSHSKPIEIMVGTIIERKEVNDLAASLYGTRYSEQRLRLSQCGLPQVLFLVEGDITQVANCPSETLLMAMMETRVQSGFQVVQTKHLNETVRVLKGLHRRVVQRTFPDAFQKTTGMAVPTYVNDPNETGRQSGDDNNIGRRRNRRPSSLLEMVFDSNPIPPFGATRFITYAELKAKVELDRERGTKRLQAITMAMLKQIPSLSGKKCTAIAEKYPTMNRLIEALCYHQGNPECVLSSITMGRKTVGPKSASEVFAACCTLADGSVVASHYPTNAPVKKMAKSTIVNTQCQCPPTTKASAHATVTQSDRIVELKQIEMPAASVASLGSITSRKRPHNVAVDKIISTPAMDGKANINHPLLDMSGWSTNTASTSTTIGRKNTDGTFEAAWLDDSFLFSSPEDIRVKSDSRSTIRSTKDLLQYETTKSHRNAPTDPKVIDILESDSTESPVVAEVEVCHQGAINCFEQQDIPKVLPKRMLDTLTSTFCTHGIPPHAEQASRKISSDSSSGENCTVSSKSDTVGGRSRTHRGSHYYEASSREEKRQNQEVIEIDL